MPVTPPPASSGGGGGGSVVFFEEGSAVGTATNLNFVGAGVTATYSGGTAVATIPGGTADGSVIFQDEGSTIGTATHVNIVGAGGTASFSGGTATVTIAGGGGSAREDGYTPPDSAGTYDEEFEGTADTLPADWSWISTPSAWSLNSTWKSWLIVDHPASTGETKELRRASVTPGAADFGIWWCWSMGVGQWNNNGSWMQFDLLNAGETEGRGWRVAQGSIQEIKARSLISSVEADAASGPTTSAFGERLFMGMTRKTSDNTWTYYFSYDGIAWTRLTGGIGHSFTIDHIRIRFNSGNNVGIERRTLDFVRSRADLLFPTPR